MGRFSLLDPRRLSQDVIRLVSDSRDYCIVYRRDPGETAESKVGEFWGRIANIGRQTTGLESWIVPGEATGTLWVLRTPPGAIGLQHNDEIRTNSTRWRVLHVRSVIFGQVAILSNIQ